MFRYALAGLAMLALLACGGSTKDSATPVDPPKASFGFAAIGVPQAKVYGVQPGADFLSHNAPAPYSAATTATNFDFGNLPSSATYFFELRNTGTVELTDARVTTDSPDFTVVTPAVVGVLPVNGQGSVIPLVSVQVLHGVGANGYGSFNTLPPGPKSIVLTATAKDPSGATITTTATVNVVVKVAGFEVWSKGTDAQGNLYPERQIRIGWSPAGRTFSKLAANRCDLVSIPSTGWWLCEFLHVLEYPALERHENTKKYWIKNTGNVPLTLKAYFGNNSDTAPAPNEDLSVAPGERVEVLAYLDPWDSTRSNWHPTFLMLDSGSVVFDHSMPMPETDGRYYLALFYYEIGNY